MSADLLTFSFAAFTEALPSIETLTPIATRLAPHSLTFQEIPDIPSFNAAAARLQHVVEALLSIDVSKRPILRYTQAPLLGYIYEELCEFDAEELRTVAALIDEWQFPKEWLTPINEQLAFHHFVATGELDVCLSNKAHEIDSSIKSAFFLAGIVAPISSFPAIDLILRRTRNLAVERLLGRAPFPSRTTSVAEWSQYYNLSVKAARGGMLDLLQHYVASRLPFDPVECRAAVYIGYYESRTVCATSALRVPFTHDDDEARTSPFYAIITWLAAQGVTVDNSDGVFGLSLAHRRSRSYALYGRDDLITEPEVLAFEVLDETDEDEEFEPFYDDFDF